jgi:two-component system, OmpR family, sensor histidine kinase BaeS
MTATQSVLPPPPPPPAWPPEPWRPPWGRVELPSTRALAIAALLVGGLFDLAVRSGFEGIAAALVFIGASVALLASGRIRQAEARALVLVAPLFGVWLMLRTSPWLLPFDFMAACALLVVGASIGRRGSTLDLPPSRIVGHCLAVIAHGALGIGFLRPLLEVRRDRASRWLAIGRGLLVCAPIVVVLWALLVNADAVFASFFTVDLDFGEGLVHIFLLVFGAWGVLAALRLASVESPSELGFRRLQLGGTEATVAALSVVILFTLFAASQVLAATGGADHVLQTKGLTYAEYARSGFFQLLWAAGLTVAGLLGLRALTSECDERSARRLTRLSLVIVGLTLVIVGVAIRRMTLYEDAYGLTMLRLYVVVFAAWLGLALLLVGALLVGVRRDQAWFPGVASLSLLGVLLALNIVNPEAVVARHNLTRSPTATPVDESYLADLSDDAVPTIVDLLPRLDDSTRARVIAAVGCTGNQSGNRGWAALNIARASAEDARAKLCNRAR